MANLQCYLAEVADLASLLVCGLGGVLSLPL